MKRNTPPNKYIQHVVMTRLPRQTKPGAFNRHHIAQGDHVGTEYTLHATKGYRRRRNPA